MSWSNSLFLSILAENGEGGGGWVRTQNNLLTAHAALNSSFSKEKNTPRAAWNFHSVAIANEQQRPKRLSTNDYRRPTNDLHRNTRYNVPHG
jgi:hypothetical protein